MPEIGYSIHLSPPHFRSGLLCICSRRTFCFLVFEGAREGFSFYAFGCLPRTIDFEESGKADKRHGVLTGPSTLIIVFGATITPRTGICKGRQVGEFAS